MYFQSTWTEIWLREHNTGPGFSIKTVFLRESLCSPHIELLSISLTNLRTIDQRRNSPSCSNTSLYPSGSQPSRSNSHNCKTRSQSYTPQFILGDFNTCSHFHQYAQRDMVKCYCTIKTSYKSYSMEPLGSSDHSCIFLGPMYQSTDRFAVWASGAIKETNGCFIPPSGIFLKILVLTYTN